MNITFERATPADAEALVQAQIAAFHHDTVLYGVELGGPPGYDSVADAIEKMQDALYYAIRLDGVIVGGIVVFEHDANDHHLDLIYLAPDYHGLGIGSQAMHFIEQAHPAARWTLDTPSWASRNQHFYEKFGYIKVGEHEADGLILFAYEKHIPPHA